MAPGCGRPRQVVAGPGGCMQSRCGPCTGACAPSPMPRLLRPVPAFPVFCCPRPVARVLRPASCVLRPASRAPVPVPASASASTCSAFCVLRPTPASSVFRTRAPHPAPAAPHPAPMPVPPSPAPRARARGSVFCVPQTVARVPRPVSPPALRGRSFRLLQAAGMKRKSGGSPEEPPDFACIAAARLTRACG